jgi:hypothetical protein
MPRLLTQVEVDFRRKGQIGTLANHGRSRYEGTADYWRSERLAKQGKLVFPVWTYGHGDGSLCSVIGGYVYRGAAVPAARGRYFLGDFCLGAIWSFKVGPKGRASAPVALGSRLPNLTSFGEDGSGELYATTLDGGLYELK